MTTNRNGSGYYCEECQMPFSNLREYSAHFVNHNNPLVEEKKKEKRSFWGRIFRRKKKDKQMEGKQMPNEKNEQVANEQPQPNMMPTAQYPAMGGIVNDGRIDQLERSIKQLSDVVASVVKKSEPEDDFGMSQAELDKELGVKSKEKKHKDKIVKLIIRAPQSKIGELLSNEEFDIEQIGLD